MRRFPTTLLLAAGVAAAIAGCGSDDDGGPNADLTEFAPADSVVFVEGTVKPDGDLKESVDSILGKFPQGDQLGGKLIDEINQSAEENDSGFTYEDDIEPWLGPQAAFYATSFEVTPTGGGETSTEPKAGALIVETTDEELARSKAREFAEQDGTVAERQYAGTTYDVVEGDAPDDASAFAVFDGVAVVGNEQGLKDVIDVANNGADSLDGEQAYADFRDEAGDDLLGSVYVDGSGLLDSIEGTGFTAKEREDFRKSYGQYLEQPIMAGLEVTDSEATLSASAAATELTSSGQVPLFESGFADSWAALGVPAIGKSFSRFFDQVSSTGLPQAEVGQFNAQLQQTLGFELSDLSDIGDAAFFAAGESILDLQVGGIVEVPDAAARTQLLAAVRRGIKSGNDATLAPASVNGADSAFAIQLRDLPVPINVATKGDQVAFGAGSATEDLLAGTGGLTSSEGFEQAQDALGDGMGVTFLLEIAPIVELVESTGQDDADFQKARPYLDAIDFITAGTESTDDRDISRTVVRFSD